LVLACGKSPGGARYPHAQMQPTDPRPGVELTAVAVPSSRGRRQVDATGRVGASSVAITPTSWEPCAELPLSEWAAQGRRLGIIGRGAGWWIGDWLRYGNERFGERY